MGRFLLWLVLWVGALLLAFLAVAHLFEDDCVGQCVEAGGGDLLECREQCGLELEPQSLLSRDRVQNP